MSTQKLIAVMLCVSLMLITLSSAYANSGDNVFKPIKVNRGLSIPVYSAPSIYSWRGANGKAACGTDGDIYAAGYEGDWVLIAYELNRGPNAGGRRVGYVQMSQLIGLRDYLNPLPLKYLSAKLNNNCILTDDPMLLETPITYLLSGTRVTYLMGYQSPDGIKFAYIETTYQGLTVRGFVFYECVTLDN